MHCVMCENTDETVCSPLQRLLPPDQSRIVAQTERLVAIPTFGAFVPGYLLVVPRAHALSFGQLNAATLAEAADLIEHLADRLTRIYRMPVLGFEYGNNLPGGRRIEHAHWHLLPSEADLGGWVAANVIGRHITGLTELPGDRGTSYIAVRDQQGRYSVHPVPNEPTQRVRLRRVVAELDPRVDPGTWDWDSHVCPDLIRQTVADLSPAYQRGTLA